VEQARGDWVQMWLSGTSCRRRSDVYAGAAGGVSARETTYLVVVFRATTEQGASLPLESLIPLVRDD